jgi:hypothetical protein
MSNGETKDAGDLGKQRPQVAGSSRRGAAVTDTGSARSDTAAGKRSSPPELPAQFGRYRVKKKLGGGGMGTVYLVENTELQRDEALKVPHFAEGDDPQVRERFLREARSAAKLDHANLCPIYDAGVLDGIYYLTMRFLKGKLLSEYSGKAQPSRKAVEIVTKLAQALEAAHVKGVIHRDLKPSNVMMVGGVGPVVMDFGLAKQIRQADQKLTQAGSTLGTPAYMPPEQVNGDLKSMGPASDVYSLGVILYELLTGRLPFEGSMAAIFGQILYTEPPLPSAVVPGLNPKLDEICAKAMAKAPAERYPSMKAFAAALIDYLRSTPGPEGAGNLTPAQVDKAAIFQTPTVAPAPPPGKQAKVSPEFRVSAMGGLRSVAQVPLRPVKESGNDVEGPERKRRQARAKSRAGLWTLIGGGVLAVLLAVASAVVVRIATDKGELVIETDDPNVEIAVKQGGKQVTIVDVRTKQEVKLASGSYELELAKGADGLRLSADKLTLSRGDREIVRVRREPVVPSPPGQPSDRGFVPIFNGKDLNGWSVDSGDENAWQVKDGELVAIGAKENNIDAMVNNGFLLTEREYSNFLLRFQFRSQANPGGLTSPNYPWGGVAMRAVPHQTTRLVNPAAKYDYPCHLTVLVSQGDDAEGTTGSLWWADGQEPWRRPPDILAAYKKAGEWNDMEVEMRGESLRIAVNGRDLQNVVLNKNRPQKNPTTELSRFSGRIGFLKRVGEVHYRNIEIKELASSTAKEGPGPVKKVDSFVPEPARPAGRGSVPIFNGKDLKGWVVDSGDENAWQVKDGELAAIGRAENDPLAFEKHGYLLTEQNYSDFLLRFQFQQATAKYAWGGVALRAVLHETRADTNPSIKAEMGHIPYHLTVIVGQPNPLSGENPALITGSLWWTIGAPNCLPPDNLAALKNVGEWNDMEVEMRGQSLRIAVNGRDVQNVMLNKTRPVTYPALGLNRFSGRIGFLKRVSEIHYRNIELKDLSSTTRGDREIVPVHREPVVANQPGRPGEQGFVPIFNGKDLAGWKTHPSQPGNWHVKDGVLIGSGPAVSHLFSERGDYKDFLIRAEVRINDGGNSGLCFRTTFGPTWPRNKPTFLDGYEAQINSTHRDHKTGALYIGPKGAVVRVLKSPVPPGEWFTQEVSAIGNRIIIKVNGATTADYVDAGRTSVSGHIALQQHNPQTVAEFRKIEIMELFPSPAK